MRRPHWRVFAAALCGICTIAHAKADVMSLNEALGIAYETNPVLDAQRASQRATDENVAQADAGYRPQVNLQGSYGFEHLQFGDQPPSLFGPSPGSAINLHPFSAQLVVSQPIFRSGKTYAEVGRAKALVKQGRAQLLDIEQQLLLETVTVFMDVVRDADNLHLQQSNVAALQKQYDDTQEEFKVGELTKTDVAQALARLNGAQAQLTTARGQLSASRAAFLQVVGRPAETLQDQPPFPILPSSEDAAIAVGAIYNPTIVAAREAEHAADLAIDDAIGNLGPQVSLQGQYQISSDGPFEIQKGAKGAPPEHVTAVLGQVTMPIYQGGAEDSQVRQAKAQHSQAQIQIVTADRQIRAAVQSAWQTFVAAESAIASNEAQVKADETAYDGVQQEQQVGARTTLDVLNAEQELLNAKVSVVVSRHDAYVAAYQLLQASGELTARYLRLPVKLYDPKKNYDENANSWIGFGD